MAEKGHTVRLKRLFAGSIQRRLPIAPPRTADGVRRRREAPGPVPPPGAAGMRTAHAPGTLEHPAAGTMTPATRGKGARAKMTRNGQQGASQTPGPSQVTGP